MTEKISCGINPAACATLFLIARIMDGLNDPFAGYMIDHLPNTNMVLVRAEF